MKFYVILIALHLLAVAYIECNSTIASKIKGSSILKRSKRRFDQVLHIQGQINWEDWESYRYNVMITWKIDLHSKPLLKIKSENEIGRIEDTWIHYKCTGALIKSSWVVTAASCFQPKIRHLRKAKGTLVFPLPDGEVKSYYQTRNIFEVFIHKDYIEYAKTGSPDVALVKVDRPFYTDKAHPDYVFMARITKNIPYSPYKDRNNMRSCLVMSYGEDDLNAKPPFTQKLSIYDVRTAGPKYCEILFRKIVEPWTDYANPMDNWNDNDMFESFHICAQYFKWKEVEKERKQENEAGLGCFGAAGSTLICDGTDMLVGVQSSRYEIKFCDDTHFMTTFTSVGHWKVYNWIKIYIPDIGELTSLWNTQYPYVRAMGDNITFADDTSSTTTVSTCGGLILSLALSVTAFTF